MEVKSLETEGLKIHFLNDYKLVVLSKFVLSTELYQQLH